MGLRGSYMNNTASMRALKFYTYVKKTIFNMSKFLSRQSHVKCCWSLTAFQPRQNTACALLQSAVKTRFERCPCLALTLYLQRQSSSRRHCSANTTQWHRHCTASAESWHCLSKLVSRAHFKFRPRLHQAVWRNVRRQCAVNNLWPNIPLNTTFYTCRVHCSYSAFTWQCE